MSVMAISVETGAQHLLLGLGILTGLLGLVKYLTEQRRRHVEALYARRRQTEILLEINKELHPNDGSTVTDAIKRIEEVLAVNTAAVAENRQAVEELRIIVTEISAIVSTNFGLRQPLNFKNILGRHQTARR